MSDPIIKIENISKKYAISHQRGGYLAVRDVVNNALKHLFVTAKRRKNHREEFWALKDINFEVHDGDVVGIIGRNGAGKSTLLKILSRITYPTTGKVIMRGSVGSLLEVGTGFHPELTGRENIYLNGAILGMTRRDIAKKFDEIVEFAGIEKFLDTPVKRYSSGMSVRLAFSVAAHLNPDILIVDEVLAVGDAEFQKKCLGKMQEVTKYEGRTVLFVSHNMGVIRDLCTRGMLLTEGVAKGFSSVEEMITEYQQRNKVVADSDIVIKGRGETNPVFISPTINGVRVDLMPEIFGGEQITISCNYESPVEGRDLCVGFNISSEQYAVPVVYSHSHLEGVKHRTRKRGTITAGINVPALAPGIYSVAMEAWLDGDPFVAGQFVGEFTILPTPSFTTNVALTSFPSLLMIDTDWEFT